MELTRAKVDLGVVHTRLDDCCFCVFVFVFFWLFWWVLLCPCLLLFLYFSFYSCLEFFFSIIIGFVLKCNNFVNYLREEIERKIFFCVMF